MCVPLSDIKAVQGDSGHAQVNMITDAYSQIPDDDQRKNAELFKEAFYEKKNLNPEMHVQQENNNTVANGNIKAFPGGTLKKVPHNYRI